MRRDNIVLANSLKYRLTSFVVDRARGNTLWDKDGNQYFDWMGVGGTIATGYNHPKVRAAIIEGLDKEYSAPLVCYSHEPAVELAERLIELFPGDFSTKVWFGNSGSEAMDFLAKIAPIAANRQRLVTFIGGFHGMTIGAGAISGHPALAKPMSPGHITKAPYANPANCPWGPCDPQECSLQCVQYLEETILEWLSPADETAAIFVEAIQSDSGEVVPPSNFLPALRDLCDRYGIWLIIDEIKTGLGRTGTMFAFEHAGIVPDAVALAKPLGGGLPLSAVIAREEMLDVDLYTAYTLGGSPVPCRASLATLDVIEDEDLLDNASRVGSHLKQKIQELAESTDILGNVRGKGLLLGVEVRSIPGASDGAAETARELVERCFEAGLVLLAFDNILEVTPPLTLTKDEASDGVATLAQAVESMT